MCSFTLQNLVFGVFILLPYIINRNITVFVVITEFLISSKGSTQDLASNRLTKLTDVN